MKEYELRMYFLVPYNISPIQQGIQAGHAALEYVRDHGETDLFKTFVDQHKTWVILNGGTTNSDFEFPNNIDDPYCGTLNNALFTLQRHDIPCAAFYEPDLNDALTAVCFIADERIFNHTDYPDFKEYFLKKLSVAGRKMEWDKLLGYDELKEKFKGLFSEWTSEIMGGEKNVVMRELVKDKKLA